MGCKNGGDFQCIGTSGDGKTKILWFGYSVDFNPRALFLIANLLSRCVGEELYRHRTEKPEMMPASVACADTGVPITVEKGAQTTNSSHAASPRPTTGWGGCMSLVSPLKMDNFTAKVQPTTYLQHPGSIGSNVSHPPALKVPPKPIQSQIPAHDTTSSSAPLKEPLAATLALVSTATVFFALAA